MSSYRIQLCPVVVTSGSRRSRLIIGCKTNSRHLPGWDPLLGTLNNFNQCNTRSIWQPCPSAFSLKRMANTNKSWLPIDPVKKKQNKWRQKTKDSPLKHSYIGNPAANVCENQIPALLSTPTTAWPNITQQFFILIILHGPRSFIRPLVDNDCWEEHMDRPSVDKAHHSHRF